MTVDCTKFEAGPDGRRCKHYSAGSAGGTCALPDEFMCTEWLKRNGAPASAEALRAVDGMRQLGILHSAPEDRAQPPVTGALPARLPAVPAAPAVPTRSLPVVPAPALAPAVAAHVGAPTSSAQPKAAPYGAEGTRSAFNLEFAQGKDGKGEMPFGIRLEDLRSLEEKGLEVELMTENLGRIHIVPSYTANDRSLELTYRNLATLAVALMAFPGSKVTGLTMPPPMAATAASPKATAGSGGRA